jgi:hypothetical protein
VAGEKEGKKERGPKGGIKHTPGRGHDTKSGKSKKKRFRKKAAKLRQQKEEAARKLWKEWDEMTPERRQLLGPKGKPKLPRPKHEN